MTDVRPSGGPVPDLQTVTGREGRVALVPLVASGGAPVCEGDVCFVPGAKGAWAEVPD
jgi:hypothetical protein